MLDIPADTILTVLEVTVIILIAWFVSQLLSRVITRAARRAGVSPRVISYIRVALNAVWIMVAVTSILSISSLAPYLSSALTISRSEEHTSELQSRSDLVCRLLLEKKKND